MAEVDADRAALRKEMWGRYGRPTLGASEEGFIVIRHRSKESADAFCALEAEHPGSTPVPHWVEERDGFWVHVYDIREEMAAAAARYQEASLV